MKIGIDCRMYQESGIGRYLRNLIYELQKLDKQNQYYLFLRKKDFENEVFSKNFEKVLADFSWYGISEQIQFPKLLNKYNLDLVHFPHFNVPIFYNKPYVVTIHDLIHQKFNMSKSTTRSSFTHKLKKLGYSKVFKSAISNSQKIFVPSEYVKYELIDLWKVESEKIVVTYEAVDENFTEIINKITPEKSKKILDKFSIRPPYLFYVGNAHPHKNIENLIKAFLNLRKDFQYLTLVLSGNDNYFWQKIKQEYKNKDIIYTGFINDEELAALYKSAQAFVMPSLEEGFGLPILEAMASGTPVVSSNRASLPEVGGNACLYFDPEHREEMEKKMKLILNDQKLRKKLKEKGLKRYKDFSFEKLALETLKIYQEI